MPPLRVTMGRRRMGKAAKGRAVSKREQQLLEESALDFSPDELREFLAGDLLEDLADPEFKERLRAKLWEFVRSRYGSAD